MHDRVTLGPSASEQWLHAPEHLAMVLARYRAARALIGTAEDVLEIGCGEGIGAVILADGHDYIGLDPDADAIEIVAELAAVTGHWIEYSCQAIEEHQPKTWRYSAAVALDVIEHVDDGAAFLAAIARLLTPYGVCVIGTPNAAFDHLASPQSQAGHVITYSHEALHALMARHFRVVQAFGMQDTALHLGHPEARHYLLMCGIGPYA